MAAFILQWQSEQLSQKLYGPQSLKYLLSHPSQNFPTPALNYSLTLQCKRGNSEHQYLHKVSNALADVNCIAYLNL